MVHVRGQPPRVTSSLHGLKVMKTTQSAFVGFVDDAFRSLPDMHDRVFCTIVDASWNYVIDGVRKPDFDRCWDTVRDCILQVFAGPAERGLFSPSVQKTLYDTVQLVFARLPLVADVSMELPNVHAYEFDFSRLPALQLRNEGCVFQPTDKPSGNIKASFARSKSRL